MRIIIETNEGLAAAPTVTSQVFPINAGAPTAVAQPIQHAAPQPPAAVAAQAAATGATNAGPAPDFSDLQSSAPHPFHGSTSAPTVSGGATSAGPASAGKPCG